MSKKHTVEVWVEEEAGQEQELMRISIPLSRVYSIAERPDGSADVRWQAGPQSTWSNKSVDTYLMLRDMLDVTL